MFPSSTYKGRVKFRGLKNWGCHSGGLWCIKERKGGKEEEESFAFLARACVSHKNEEECREFRVFFQSSKPCTQSILFLFLFFYGLTEDDAFRHFSLSLYGSVSNSKSLVLTLSFPSRYISSPLLIFPQSHLELGAFLVLCCSAISMLICWSAAPDAIRGSSSKSDFGEKEKSLKSSHRH